MAQFASYTGYVGGSSGGGGGSVNSVTASTPLASSGGTDPNITISQATTSTGGFLDSTDWNTFNNKQNSLTLGNLTDAGTDGITITGGSGAVVGSGTSISQHVADGSHNGYLLSTDWTTFNGKQSALTIGNLTEAGTDGITVTNGTGAVIGTGTSISQHVSDSGHNGYLSSTDWNTFNGKQAAGSYITALTGDGTASGPGSVAFTLATVNSDTGTFGSSTLIPQITVNGKGLITAITTNMVASSLPSPLEALASYTSNYFGAPGTFLGNASDSDQTNQVIYIGSTDTSIAANSTSTVLLISGDLTGTSTGGVNAGFVYVQAGNVISGDGQPGTVCINAGNAQTAQGGEISLTAGSSNTSQGGLITINAGSTHAGSLGAGSVDITAGNSFGGLGGNVVIGAGTGTTNGSISLQVSGATGKIKLQDTSVGTAGQVWTSTDAFGSGHWAAPAVQTIQTAVFNNSQTSGTLSGTGVETTWTQRVLNTTQTSQSWASLSSNQITLSAGTYYIEASSPFYSVAQCQSRFYNVTDSVVALGGSSDYANTLSQARSVIQGVITIAGSKTFELDYWMSATGGTGQDLGAAASTGSNEIYAIVSITKNA